MEGGSMNESTQNRKEKSMTTRTELETVGRPPAAWPRLFPSARSKMTRALRRLTRPADEPSLGLRCGLRDLATAGWFNRETGELFHGYPLSSADTHLDVGCGDGGATLFAAERGSRVIATDVLPDKIAALERRLATMAGTDSRCLVSDTDPLPLPDETATRITCCEVLEHVPDPAGFLTELARVGTPGALYLLTVPDPLSEEVQLALAPPEYWRTPNHVRILGRERFAELVTSAGLVIQARHSVGFYSAVWWALFWSSGIELGQEEGPLLAAWSRAWEGVLAHPDGIRIKRALDQCLPKSQVIVARKPE
jgi:SAM-dependent methyltransferase